MRFHSALVVLIATLFIGAIVPMQAGVIAARLPGTEDFAHEWSLSSGQFLTSSWTQDAAANESIAIFINGTGQDPTGQAVPGSFGFQLTKAIGPSATAADVVGNTTISVNQSTTAFLEVFSGLSLDAGTYFLTAYGIDGFGSWPALLDPTLTGVLGQESFAANFGTPGDLNSTDPYRSNAYNTTLDAGILVQGDAATPEPASILLVTTGMAALILSRRRRA